MSISMSIVRHKPMYLLAAWTSHFTRGRTFGHGVAAELPCAPSYRPETVATDGWMPAGSVWKPLHHTTARLVHL
jgi:hypothetical protein